MFGIGRARRAQAQQIPTVGSRPARTAPGARVYAIGDVHGRLDLLEALVARIREDARHGAAGSRTLVMLGDYIDRGPESAAVVDWLIDYAAPELRLVALMGNHEDTMIRFLDDIRVGSTWLYYGGSETLESYGIAASRHEEEPAELRRLQAQLRLSLPRRHLDFLAALPLVHVDGDYLFVHAGVRPGVSLGAQAREDLLWIRDEFLQSEGDHGKVVVHGHTIAPEPEFRKNRIGIDTGAFVSDRLTCLVLENDAQRMLHT